MMNQLLRSQIQMKKNLKLQLLVEYVLAITVMMTMDCRTLTSSLAVNLKKIVQAKALSQSVVVIVIIKAVIWKNQLSWTMNQSKF